MKCVEDNSSLVMHPGPLSFQAYESLVLLSCPQLPSKLLVCLDGISLAQPTIHEAAGQPELRYVHLQLDALHWYPVFCIRVTMTEVGNVGNSCSPRDSSDFQAQKSMRHKALKLKYNSFLDGYSTLFLQIAMQIGVECLSFNQLPWSYRNTALKMPILAGHFADQLCG